MWYTYILLSKKDNKLYTGYTNNLLKRLEKHNKGEVYATKNREPFKLIYYEWKARYDTSNSNLSNSNLSNSNLSNNYNLYNYHYLFIILRSTNYPRIKCCMCIIFIIFIFLVPFYI